MLKLLWKLPSNFIPKSRIGWRTLSRSPSRHMNPPSGSSTRADRCNNPADRDHCMQYMTAIGILFGELNADHYEDATAKDLRIDVLRSKMSVKEDPRYSREYLESNKRSIANAVQVFFKDGSSTAKVEVEYPIGHRRRRAEGIPLLINKFKTSLASRLPAHRVENILNICNDQTRLEAMPVSEFIEHFVI